MAPQYAAAVPSGYRGSCIVVSNFHNVFKSGPKPQNTLECATYCSENKSCSGYDVSDDKCSLLYTAYYVQEDGHWVYESEQRTENVQTTTSIATAMDLTMRETENVQMTTATATDLTVSTYLSVLTIWQTR